MSSPESSLSGRIRVMQIVAAALIFGASSFLVVCVYMVQNNQGKGQAEPAEGELPMISLAALGFLLVILPIAFVLPAINLRSGVQTLAGKAPDSHVMPASNAGPGGPITDSAYLLLRMQTAMIVRLAPLEGAAFFGAIAYLQEARPLALIVSGVCIGLMVLFFPSEGRVLARLEQLRRDLAEARMR
jgi:hypothetical protein